MAKSSLGGVAFVTGAASGIGREAAFSFAESGASAVVFVDKNVVGAGEAAQKSKTFATNPEYKTLTVRADVTNKAEVEQAISIAVEEFQRIDYGVNSAGVSLAEYIAFNDSPMEDFERVMHINSTGGFICTQALCRAMQLQTSRSITTRNGIRDIGRGAIVNVASAMAYAPVAGKVGYTASKHALLGITKSAALENASSGIRVNVVCPTWVRTAMFEFETSKTPEMPDVVKKLSPLGRPAEADEVADVIMFLSGPGSSYVTGTGLIIDAGFTLTFHIG